MEASKSKGADRAVPTQRGRFGSAARLLAAVLVFAVAACLAAPQAAYAASAFKDVNSKTPHQEDIVWLKSEGITKGFDDGTFRPFDTVKRCDMAAFLYRLAGEPDYTPTAADKRYFSDVDSKTPHAKEIWWLASMGISKGWDVAGGRHEFRPYDTVKRCDMAAFLMRLVYGDLADVAYAPTIVDAGRFSDVSKGTPHSTAVWWLAYRGITKGWDEADGTVTFRPYDEIKRCDMAAFLRRLADSGLMDAKPSSEGESPSVESGGGQGGSPSSGSSGGSSSASGGSGSSSSSSSGGSGSGESGSGSSGGSSTSTGKKACSACGGTGRVKTGTETVTDKKAWDETVTDKAAWDEWVVDQEEWTERVYLGVEFSDGTFFGPDESDAARAHEEEVALGGGSISNWNVYDYILHEEEGHWEHHDAVTHTVHHDAVTHAEDVYDTCPTCGGTGKV